LGLAKPGYAHVAYTDTHVACGGRGTVSTMRTTMDTAGRLVVPLALRSQVGLVAGGEVEIEVDGGIVRIEPVAGQGFIEEGGRLVIPPAGIALDDAAVRGMRDLDQR